MLWLAAATTILVLGDSHVSGPASAPAGPPFPRVLGEILGEGFEVRSSGCAGSSVRDWTRDSNESEAGRGCAWGGAYAIAEPHLPVDIAVVVLGTNGAVGFAEETPPDAEGHRSRSPIGAEEYQERMSLLLDRIREDGARRAILIPPPSRRDHRRAWTLRLRQYARALEALAREREDVLLGPDLFRLLGPEDFGGSDIHMNGPGHRKLAEALAPIVRSAATGLPPRAEADDEPRGEVRLAPAP